MKLFFICLICCVFKQNVLAQSQSLVRSTTGASGASSVIINGDNTYIIQQSVGQPSVIGTIYSENYILRQGFIQPDVLAKIVEKNIPLDLHLSIYPNPFDEKITLSFHEEIKGEINVEVFDILGRQVFKKVYQKGQQTDIILNKLPSGEYILKTIANRKQFISKIIKK